MNKTALLSCLLFAGAMAIAPAQNAARVEFPAPSPESTVKQRVGLTDIEIVYSRPGMKGRQIYGGLVPHGEVWRTGANASTKISFSTDVKLNGTTVPAGKYSLLTIPGEKEWTVIINKDVSRSPYSQQNDLVRFKVEPVKLSEPVETFRIDINDIRDDSATINIDWEKTRVPVQLKLDLASNLVPKIESAMSGEGGGKPYYQAAMFYYDHNLDINKARQWIEAAAKANETYYITHLKAKILARAGDKQGAIAAAQRSTELAQKAAGASGFVKMNNDLIASLK